jgi:membrane-associated protease RseP (regulator of RpoE activity)
MDMLGRGSRRAVALAAIALATLCSAARADDDAPPKKAASLGVATSRITDTWREKNAYRASGVLVVGVDPSGRAARSGIAAGDVLVSVDGRTLREPSDLGYAERKMEASKPVAVVLARDGGHSIKVFDIAPVITDGGEMVTLLAAPAVTSTTATPDAAASPEPAKATEPSGSSFITDSAPFGGTTTTAPEGAVTNSVEPGPAIIIARGDTAAPPADKPANNKSGAEELGVRAQPLTPDLATALGSEGVEGVLVLEVSKESPADHAGLRAGDIIFKIGEQSVKDMGSLDQAVAVATNPAAISMLRRGDQQMVLAPLEGHPAPASDVAAAAAATPADQEQVINELKGEVASLKKEMADLRAQIAKLVADSAKPKQ